MRHRPAGGSRGRAALALAVGLACLLPAAARADSPWLPLGAGARWEYSLHRDLTLRPSSGPVGRTFRIGKAVRERRGTREASGGQIEIAESQTEEALDGGPAPPVERSLALWSDAGGLLLHAIEPAVGPAVRFQPPLRMLPAAPVPGARWSVGRMRSGDVEAALEGEVLGFETVTEAGVSYPGCLVVRYRGPLSETQQKDATSPAIRGGTLERTVWFASGVGVVRERSKIEARIEVPEKGTLRSDEVVTLRLTGHRAGD